MPATDQSSLTVLDEMAFELEGEPPRIIRAGEAFHEPGGDVIHSQAANHLTGAWSMFVAVMPCQPGQPMLTYVEPGELAARRHLRHPGARTGTEG